MRSRILAAALLALAFTPAAHAKKLAVMTSLSDLASLTSTIGGDRVEADSLAKGYQDPHFVEAKPTFILKLSRADLLIVAGLELEIGYLPPLIDQSRNARIHPGAPGYLDASAGCEILGRPTQQVTRAMGDVHPYGNPHYWTDPENGRVIARAIAAKLSELDPAHKADYDRSLQAFETKLTAKDAEWRKKLAPYAGSKIVTFHDSWPNFAKHFQLVVAGQVEPKPGIPPSPSHTLEIVNLVLGEKIRVILVEPYFDLKTPKYVADKTGAAVVVGYPSVGGTKDIPDYFALFDKNVDGLAAAFGGKP